MEKKDTFTFKFVINSDSLADNTFNVISFTGNEAIGQYSEFEVLLSSENHDIDFKEVMSKGVTFSIISESKTTLFHGFLSYIEHQNTINEFSVYKAVMVSKMHYLTLTHYYQIFLDQSIPEIIEQVLSKSGFSRADYEMRLYKEYQKKEYVCQYNESNYHFIKRWMERSGIYFFIENDGNTQKYIFTDSKFIHANDSVQNVIKFRGVGGLEEMQIDSTAKNVHYAYKRVPAKVIVKDYFYEKPFHNLFETKQIVEDNIGEVYSFNANIHDNATLKHYATVKAESQSCMKESITCDTYISNIKPGCIYELQNHPRSSLNQKYLAIRVEHRGYNTFYRRSGFDTTNEENSDGVCYSNNVTMIPSDVQYRLPQTTAKPKTPGMISAKIDAATDGKYPELDSQGRYKVIMPFDLNVKPGGKASIWLRMAQPSAGEIQGMHFPLHKGTEVLIDFVGGNPDNPIISAAVPNPATQSPVNDKNLTKSKILSSSGNTISLDDLATHESMHLKVPNKNTKVFLGDYTDHDNASASGVYTEAPSYTGTIAGNHSWKVNQNYKSNVALDSNEHVGGKKTFTTTSLTSTGKDQESTWDSIKTFVEDRFEYTYALDVAVFTGLGLEVKAPYSHGIVMAEGEHKFFEVSWSKIKVDYDGLFTLKREFSFEEKDLHIIESKLEKHTTLLKDHSSDISKNGHKINVSNIKINTMDHSINQLNGAVLNSQIGINKQNELLSISEAPAGEEED